MGGITPERRTASDEVTSDAVITPAADFVLLLCLTLGVAATLVVLL